MVEDSLFFIGGSKFAYRVQAKNLEILLFGYSAGFRDHDESPVLTKISMRCLWMVAVTILSITYTWMTGMRRSMEFLISLER